MSDNNNNEEQAQENIEETNTEEKREEPNYQIKYKKFKNCLSVKVMLHKIPPQLINFDPTATHFHLDTLKYSKKYYLNFPYPYGITVDIKEGEEPQATFAHGTLTALLPIKQMDEKLLPHRETFAERKKRLSKKRKERDNREKEIAKKTENDNKNNKNNKNAKKPRAANTTKNGKKRTTTTTEDLDILENINKQLDSVRDQKIEKDKNKQEWEEQQVEKKKKKQEKESQVLTAIRESVVEKLQSGKFKGQAPKKPATTDKQNAPTKKTPPTKNQAPRKTPNKTPNKRPAKNNNNNRNNTKPRKTSLGN